jgi:hypothetical protein
MLVNPWKAFALEAYPDHQLLRTEKLALSQKNTLQLEPFSPICTEEAMCLRKFSVYALDLEVLAPHRLLFQMGEHLCETFQHVTVP